MRPQAVDDAGKIPGAKLMTSDDFLAAYGGSVATTGNQIFVVLRRGKEWPPEVCDVR